MVFKYNSAKAVSYANSYVGRDNPFYKKFENGEDCNFVSQCLLAGSENVSDEQEDGWFYENEKKYSKSWSDQSKLFYHLLTARKGPFGRSASKSNLCVGDLVFFSNENKNCVGIVTKLENDEVFFLAKEQNFKLKKVQNEGNFDIKYLHILGVKK